VPKVSEAYADNEPLDIYDIAEAIGEDPEDLAEALGIDLEDDFWEAFDPLEDPDVFDELADILDLDVSDIYDMYYGYAPGES
jgi:hypothetical protein